MTCKISVVIPTYNEQKEIGDILNHLDWCDEIIIVDSQSEDRTREIARKHNAVIVDVPAAGPGEPFDHYRQTGVGSATNEWILSIDADERIPQQLKSELTDHINRKDGADIVEAPRANHLQGQILFGSGQWPDYRPILFRVGSITFTKTPHSFWKYNSEAIRQLPADEEIAIQHKFADSLFDHWQAQRRYAKVTGRHRVFKFRHLLSPFYGLYERFIKEQGYTDGIAGVGISLIWAWYQTETTFRSAVHRK